LQVGRHCRVTRWRERREGADIEQFCRSLRRHERGHLLKQPRLSPGVKEKDGHQQNRSGRSREPILLRAKTTLSDRVPAYLQNCRLNVIVMLDALDRVDFETVTSLGHQMQGSGGSFGFQAITDIGAALQQAGESADDDVSRKWVRELSDYLDGVATISN